MRIKALRISLATTLLLSSPLAQGETVVTTYVTKVQEERESTRWTLTEWLRIKERMRLMDVWLAIFSSPEKDKFRPELNISYGLTKGQSTLTNPEGGSEQASVNGRTVRAQLWLTNILSSSAGIRTLNVDLGFEGFARDSGPFAPAAKAASIGADSSSNATNATAASSSSDRSLSTQRAIATTYYAADLRVFGKNIQDSSLVLKYGQYQSKNSVPYDVSGEASFKGIVAGAELQLYLLKALGIEGNYLNYGGSQRLADESERKGHYHDYTAFVEVSLLRLMIGRYEETWNMTESESGSSNKIREQGLLAGMKLQF